MMWLSRNTKILDPPPFKNGKFMPVLSDQVTQYFGLLMISLISATSTSNIPITGGKRIMGRTRSHVSIT